jgi:hypothetical protein
MHTILKHCNDSVSSTSTDASHAIFKYTNPSEPHRYLYYCLSFGTGAQVSGCESLLRFTNTISHAVRPSTIILSNKLTLTVLDLTPPIRIQPTEYRHTRDLETISLVKADGKDYKEHLMVEILLVTLQINLQQFIDSTFLGPEEEYRFIKHFRDALTLSNPTLQTTISSIEATVLITDESLKKLLALLKK